MSQVERTGVRLPTYSVWHRRDSIKRYTPGGEVVASRLAMIDIDGMYVEAKHPYDRLPAALVETVQIKRELKPTDYYPKGIQITYQIGKAANIPVFLVLYRCDEAIPNPANPDYPDIVEFYLKEYYPVKSELWKVYSPEQYTRFLVWLRQNHIWIKKNGRQYLLPFDDCLTELDDSDLERRWYVHEWDKREFKR